MDVGRPAHSLLRFLISAHSSGCTGEGAAQRRHRRERRRARRGAGARERRRIRGRRGAKCHTSDGHMARRRSRRARGLRGRQLGNRDRHAGVAAAHDYDVANRAHRHVRRGECHRACGHGRRRSLHLLRGVVAALERNVVVAVSAGGLVGALADSFGGALFQSRRFCSHCERETERQVHDCGTRTERAGGMKWLNNDGVNAACTLVGAVASMAALELLR